MPIDINLAKIKHNLKTKIIGKAQHYDNEYHLCIDSTSNRVIQLAKNGAGSGVMVLAFEQSAGRGRLGNSFVSPAGHGLYFSILLKTEIENNLNLFTLGLGLAVSKAILQNTGYKIQLKWVNDLIANGKKLGGILVESPFVKGNDKVLIIGIGININSFDYDLANLPNPIEFLESVAIKQFDINNLICDLALEIENLYLRLNQSDFNKSDLINEWKTVNCTLNKNIMAKIGDVVIYGKAIDIDENGALLLETEGQAIKALSAGQISIRNADGSYV